MSEPKLIACGKIERSDFKRLVACSVSNSAYSYATYRESGVISQGVCYPNGGNPYRLLSLIVPDRKDRPYKPQGMKIIEWIENKS